MQEQSHHQTEKSDLANSRYSKTGLRSSTLDNTAKNTLLQTHFTKVMDKNDAYFNHLKGNCVCGRCICGQCKCPKMLVSLDYKKGQESLYQKEYAARDRTKHIPLIDHNATYKSKLPMEMNTIQRQSYYPHPEAKAADSLKPEQRVFLIPFSSGTSYQVDYDNSGGMSSLVIKPPFHPTVVDMPFKEKSSYQNNFYQKPIPKEEFQISGSRSTFKNPINPELPFIYTSTNSQFYKPFKTGLLQKNETPQNIQSIPAFEGQFSSTTQNDFGDKNPQKCPSRVYLNSLYKSKLRALAQ